MTVHIDIKLLIGITLDPHVRIAFRKFSIYLLAKYDDETDHGFYSSPNYNKNLNDL